MKKGIAVWIASMLLWSAAGAEIVQVGEEEERTWLNWLIPLPKEIGIGGKVELSAVQVRLRPGAGELEAYAASLLKEQMGGSEAAEFEILVGLFDEEGRVGKWALPEIREQLLGLPNREQAYAIWPVGEEGMVLAALREEGVWNGAQTLLQLLERNGGAEEGMLPLARVVDWPDLAQRGLWDDTFSGEQIEWMAAHKLNRIDCHTRLKVNEEGRGTVERLPAKRAQEIDGMDFPAFCRLRGMRYVPIISHLSHLRRTGIYDVLPELKGKGAAAEGRFIAPCAAQLQFAEILEDWMRGLADRANIEEIAVWLGEEIDQCECDVCRVEGQHLMEARAIVAAYREVEKDYPELRLWVLLSQGSYASNGRILDELPAEVGAIYYHGIKTYDSSREPMIYYRLREEAARGREVGVCPQLTVSWAVVCPWSGPQFARARMVEFVDKGLSLMSGYATPDIDLYAFNVAAAAEWGWNAHGRDEREFALAWATRKGVRDPTAAAEWAVSLGRVSWNVYGSLVPYHFIRQWGEAVRAVENRVRPIPGEGMFRYFASREQFERDLEICARGLKLARGLGEPELIEESLVVEGYVRMVRALYDIGESVWRKDVPLPVDRLREQLVELNAACRQTNDALQRWEGLFGEDAGGGRFDGTLKMAEEAVAAIGAALADMGVADGGKSN
jgi:hypothetical protein